jgi:hypothetical protein
MEISQYSQELFFLVVCLFLTSKFLPDEVSNHCVFFSASFFCVILLHLLVVSLFLILVEILCLRARSSCVFKVVRLQLCGELF